MIIELMDDEAHSLQVELEVIEFVDGDLEKLTSFTVVAALLGVEDKN